MAAVMRVSLTGVDGSGKTTIIRRLRERQADFPGVAAFQAPQFHEDPLLPRADLSKAIDDLSVAADLSGDVSLKSLALFLSMTMYGDMERHILETRRPSVLIGERQCVLDALTYARFYLPLLSSGAAPSRGGALHPLIMEWLGTVAARAPEVGFDAKDLTGSLVRVFTAEPAVLVPRLLKLFAAELPDHIVILGTSPQDLAARLVEKRGSTNAELHETAETLQGLAHALQKTAPLLQLMKPGLRVHGVSTQGRTADESVDDVLRTLDIEVAVTA